VKAWHIMLIVILIALVGFGAWLVSSYRNGRNGR
jgi:hypothetical protein